MSNLLQSLLVPVVVIIGLIVLIALGDVSANVGVPVIVGLAGVHVGANLTPTTTPATSTTTVPVVPPVIP